MKATPYRLADLGTDLSSRHRASSLRNTIVAAVEAGRAKVCLDFTDVRTVSSSFADELIAVLVVIRGEEWFQKNISVTGMSVDVRQTVLESVDERISAQESQKTV